MNWHVGKVCHDPLLMEAAVLKAFNAQYKQPPQPLAAGVNSARTVTKAEAAEGQELWEHLAPGRGVPCWPSEGLGCWPELRRAGTWTYGCCWTEHCWGLQAELSPEPSAEQRSAGPGSTYSLTEDFFLWPFTKKELSALLIVATSVPCWKMQIKALISPIFVHPLCLSCESLGNPQPKHQGLLCVPVLLITKVMCCFCYWSRREYRHMEQTVVMQFLMFKKKNEKVIECNTLTESKGKITAADSV